LINEKNEAFGTEYKHFETAKVAKANKEVILSAGAIGSPQILLLSGIGPKKHLQEMGVIQNLHSY